MIYHSFCNTKQLLEAAKKLIYIIHLKAFLCKLDNVSLLKYVCMCVYIYIYICVCVCVCVCGTAVAQLLRCCATNRKVAGLNPAGVIGIFH